MRRMTPNQKIWLIAFFTIVVFAAALPSIPVAFAQDIDNTHDDKTYGDESEGKSCPSKNKGMTT